MLLKRIFFIFLLLGSLSMFIISAVALSGEGTPNSQLSNIFQVSLFVFFTLLLILSNIMYFTLSKTVYLLITLLIFLLFMDFYWVIIRHNFLVAGFYSVGVIFLVVLNYYILRNYFKTKGDQLNP